MTGYTPRLPEGCSLVSLQKTGSTNDHAKDLAKKGWPEGTVVWAQEQTAGRGRHGNSWTSIPGNLFATMILRPKTNAALSGQLSFLAAVALARTLKPLLPDAADISLKWPNDLLINGKKAAGILLETEVNGVRPVEWVIIGIGVNITAAPEGAISLSAAGEKSAESGHVLETLVANAMSLYNDWKKNGFDAVRTEWLDYARDIGKTINVRLPKATFAGIFRGIDENGALQLDMQDGSRKIITSGEVFTGQ